MPDTPKPAPLPEFKALLAIDVVNSSHNPNEHLPTIPSLIKELTSTALAAVGIDTTTHEDEQPLGDGFLRTYPTTYLPALVDMLNELDRTVTPHNTWKKPELGLRVALHVAPLPQERGFYRPNIELARMLEAGAFKHLVQRCHEVQGAFSTALIVSQHVYDVVFYDGYTSVIADREFAPFPITNKEFSGRTWVRVGGISASQLAEFADEANENNENPPPTTTSTSSTTKNTPPNTPTTPDDTPAAATTQPRAATDHRSITNNGIATGPQNTGDNPHFGDVHRETQNYTISNKTSGDMYGVQAGHVDGDVNVGSDRR